jgi:hypothetical protein
MIESDQFYYYQETLELPNLISIYMEEARIKYKADYTHLRSDW